MRSGSLRVKKRITTLFFVFMCVFFVLGGRLFWVQFVQGSELSEKATRNRTWEQPVESKRGTIYDANMQELAISISTDTVVANPTQIGDLDDARAAAEALAPVLGMEESTIFERITRNSSYEYVKRQITQEQSAAVRELDVEGISLVEESRRYYPKGMLAGHVLGIAGIDNDGLEGIDFYYDELVGGTPGYIVVERDAAGREMEDGIHEYVAPIDGANLVLTIDETIQYVAERELDKVIAEHDPDRALAVVMNPKTGAILAMAMRPGFDPNSYNDYPASNRRNFAICDRFEPGSTMKIITSAMLMEEKVVNEYSRFYCPGSVKVGAETIRCSNHTAHGDQTFAQIVENSCNVGFAKAGLQLGVEKYYHYLEAFGFTGKTGIDLPGEDVALLVPKKWAEERDIYLATMAMGQANAITPLQLLTAVSAVCNEGKLMKPYILEQAVDHQGNVVYQAQPEPTAQVISAETAKELCLILEGEVINGTGKNAYIEGYRVGGKTGTAQKIDPEKGGYLTTNNYYVSFIGLAPSNDPELVCIVAADYPKYYPYYGGTVCAPAVREILKDSLIYMGEPLQHNGNGLAPEAAPQIDTRLVPDVVNMERSEAESAISSRGFNAVIQGEGNTVWRQTPAAKTRMEPGSQVIIYLTDAADAENGGTVTVPELQGRSMRQVSAILADLGLYLVPAGSGVAFEQNPAPGQQMSSGSIIQVKFRSTDEAAALEEQAAAGAEAAAAP
ncbi:MAG: penicillin-binding transpeptidase domain-containing protein [Syntrophomonadaceae bacterium]|nr:penicillin-binding transpeptidase domain-containing protein [Syntrophomonadaceae bacterium]